jgi:Zn-dependent protease
VEGKIFYKARGKSFLFHRTTDALAFVGLVGFMMAFVGFVWFLLRLSKDKKKLTDIGLLVFPDWISLVFWFLDLVLSFSGYWFD